MDWYENEYIPRVGKRGAEIIDARGASSAASAANAAIDHVHDWVQGAERRWARWRSARTASYDVDEGLISSFPVRVSGGAYEIVEGLEVDDFARGKIDATVGELQATSATACASSGLLMIVSALKRSLQGQAGCQPLSRFTTWPSDSRVGITRYR